MPNLNLCLIFPEGMSKEREMALRDKHNLFGSVMIGRYIIIHRAKLKHIPVIEITAYLGPPEERNYKLFTRRLNDICIGLDRFAWRWTREDAKVYEYLKDRFEVKVKLDDAWDGEFHTYWPISVFNDRKVQKEVKQLLDEPFLSAENEDDVELLKEFSWWHSRESEFKKEFEGKTLEEKKRFIANDANESIMAMFKSFYERLTKLREEVGSEVWFAFHYF